MDDFVSVSVRIKPTFSENTCLQVLSKQPAVLLVVDKKSQTFHLDNIFTEDYNQEEIYNQTVKNLVDKVKNGYNCTVFAYGQTGTGKTYTIGTNPDINQNDAGLIPRTLEDFFESNDKLNEVEISVSFFEIYNEKVFDLLSADKKPLTVKGFSVQGLEKINVNSAQDALDYLKIGITKRHTGGTRQNSNSSRSHSVFSIYCISRNSDYETIAKLNLVDLAGSESIKKTGNQGSSLFEGININKGLLSLGQVMTALSNNSSHVPYRQSLVTTILQDSLNKRNYVSLIACVSQNSEDLGETLQTLEFSTRVKRMKNKPEVNEFISQYRKDNPSLFNANRGLTPLKRSNQYSYKTPFKKPKIFLPSVSEPSSFNISPIFSSSTASGVSDNNQNFSPVIKKYMTVMEKSIMNKLESVIKDTLRRPPRKRSYASKENFSPKKIFNGQFNGSISFSSSPKNIDDFATKENFKGLLNDSFDQFTTIKNDSDFNFKVPKPKIAKAKTKKRVSTFALVASRRRSIRLQNRNPSEMESEKYLSPEKTGSPETEKALTPPETFNRRRSVRIQSRTNVEENKTCSQCNNCGSKKSPITARTKEVLDILNKGKRKDIEKLHTVGSKTAEKILLFREIHGKFTSVSDISELPYFSKKKFDKFLAENFLQR